MNPFHTLRGVEPRRALRLAVGLWLLFALTIGIIVAIRPDKRTVTPEYRQASEKWWAGDSSIYNMTQVGYLYLPQAAIFYTPYQVLPKRVGEPLWRLSGLALLACGLWRVAGLMNPAKRAQLFLGATLLVIPATLSSARNGQVNLPLAGLMLLTVAELALGRWTRATLWLLLSVMLKPIALAPALLAAACYAPLRLRLAAGFLLGLAAAYLHPSVAYVTDEYHRFWAKLLLAGQPLVKNNFSDFFGMLWHWGIHPAPALISILRALAAGGALLLSLQIMRRFHRQQAIQAFGVMLLAAFYLMLFNPRTEENSYVILAGFTAILAARDILAEQGKRAAWLIFFCLLLAVENYGPIYPLTRIWFKPLITSVFLIIFVVQNFLLLQPISDEEKPAL